MSYLNTFIIHYLKQEEYSWLNEQNTKVLKQALRQMLTAYNNF